MATATSFALARRWMLLPSRRSDHVPRWEPGAGLCQQGYVIVQMAVAILSLSLLVTAPARASESAGVEERTSETPSVEIVSGVTYRAGTRLTIPGTQWSFVVPEHWQSNRPDDADMPFLTPEDGQDLGMLFPLTEVTRESVRDQLSQPLSLLHGVSFVPAGAQTENESTIAQSYQGEDMAGRALAVLGPGDVAVIYFFMGPHDAALFQSVLEQLGQSTRFSAPVAQPGVGL
ncbi:MAG: hypothetical protein JSR62_02570 [Nitrospira sp.]|nr:hypothetical protein [Nitrospira sp.]